MMKQFLLALFIISAGWMKSQCSLTTSVTPPSCPGNCDANVTINLSPGCTAFPYNLVINGGTCTPTGTFVMSSSSITFSNLCSCTSPFTAVLYGSLPIPITFTTFTVFGGVPLTVVAAPFPASCLSCCDGSITANVLGGTAPYTYSWTPAISSGTVASGVCAGVYSVCVMDSKGCSNCTTTTVSVLPTGMNEHTESVARVSDQKDEIVITNVVLIDELMMYDLTGRLVYKSENSGLKEIRISKNQFNKGIYVLSIESGSNVSKRKVIIE